MKIKNRKKNDRIRFFDRPKPICPNCGKPGPHFAPPSFREEGFFTCTKAGQ